MSMFIQKFFNFGKVYAHCDVPCGVYTTHRAGIAAETVEKMVKKITSLKRPVADADALAWQAYNNSMTRFIAAKEEWAQICKEELWILWTDYFKEEQLEKFPDLHDTFWKAAKLCSVNKRDVNLEAANQLRGKVNEISKMFQAAEGEKASNYRKEWL
ncbi:MAG: superoxide dismutase, Ni [Candidatus Spechtbacteria bacterium RIFCSPLOWO2_01_FULL_46_10]|uniref:Superoxide dismutase, Ni n=1 Tax=Candidatus Spechtbacteria bacterium RIFCSPLOWO2_01_FULL_46_10 TaxID=1802163 RepID=A0A1G2HHW8_9BACT|nr:MAG: superoxide dismutase, Ni [Candidatus Spechtbacteria bacterium RIFCSPLOWO2_01_FULL_46_10]